MLYNMIKWHVFMYKRNSLKLTKHKYINKCIHSLKRLFSWYKRGEKTLICLKMLNKLSNFLTPNHWQYDVNLLRIVIDSHWHVYWICLATDCSIIFPTRPFNVIPSPLFSVACQLPSPLFIPSSPPVSEIVLAEQCIIIYVVVLLII